MIGWGRRSCAGHLMETTEMDDELDILLEKSRQHTMTPEELEEQRISFAFGNTNLEDPEITRADVVRSSELLKLMQSYPSAEQ